MWVLACSRSALLSPFHPIAKTTLFIGGGGIFIQTGAREFHTLPPFLSILNGGGRIHAAPRFFLFRTGAVVFTPPPVSFRFERGRSYSHRPLFLSIENGGSVNPTRCPSFISVSNGGSVIPTRCPLFLPVSNGGSVILHAAPRFFLF